MDTIHEWAERFDRNNNLAQDGDARVCTADLFLPLVTLLADNVTVVLQRLGSDLRLRLLRLVLLVVRSCTRDKLLSYFGAQTQLAQEGLLVLLNEALHGMHVAMVSPHKRTLQQQKQNQLQLQQLEQKKADAQLQQMQEQAAEGRPAGGSTRRPARPQQRPTAGGAKPRSAKSQTLPAGGAAGGPSGEDDDDDAPLPVAKPQKRQPTASELDEWTVASTGVVDVLHRFLELFERELVKEGNRLFMRAFALLQLVFENATPEVEPHLYNTLHLVVHRFRDPLFKHVDNSFCEVLTFLLLSHW